MLYATSVDLEDTLLSEISHFSSVTQLCLTLCNPMNCSVPDLPVHHQLLESTQTHVHVSVMPSNHLILCHPLLLLLSIFPSIRAFSNESGGQSIGVSASASVFQMNMQDLSPLGCTGWISLQYKGLSRVLQHHSSKASILRHTAFFIFQLSHLYMTTGKTIALNRRTFADKVMPLLFKMLSRLVITFFPRSKHLLISRLQSPSAVILEPQKIKSATVSPSICHEVMGPDAMILVF